MVVAFGHKLPAGRFSGQVHLPQPAFRLEILQVPVDCGDAQAGDLLLSQNV